MKRVSLCVIAAGMTVLAAGAAFGESVWVQTASVRIAGGKGPVYPVLGTATKGTELAVVSRDGPWVQVQSGQVTGWVYETSLSAKKVGAGIDLGGGPKFVKADDAASSRGLTGDSKGYAAEKHMDARPMEHLEQVTRSITPQEWEEFSRAVKQTGAAMPTPSPAVR